MKYGLIGEHLKHSFSKEIHQLLGDYEYQILEIAPGQVGPFIQKKEFLGINVTIPYKETVMPYLDWIDPAALEIGSVNTVVQKQGKLYGYNTDYAGMKALIQRLGFCFSGKKVLILGTGGTSKTAVVVAKHLGASSVIRVSRSSREGAVSYEEAYSNHSDTSYVINTTPCGMFPSIENCPIQLDAFPSLMGVVDAIYNPLRTVLVSQARNLGISAEGGLYMLVAQAVFGSQLFLDTTYPEDLTETVYRKILRQKENIVLTGMPSSGKTTLAKLLSENTGRESIDTDEEIVKEAGMPIPEIFSRYGESYFRTLESQVIARVSALSGKIIATGGGAILKDENIFELKKNGCIFFIDRPLELLLPTEDRPLASSAEAIRKRYEERYQRYLQTADCIIKNDGSAQKAAEQIEENLL